MKQRKLISIVAPFYNEGPAIEPFFSGLKSVIDGLADCAFEVICVDDGSSDDTLLRLLQCVAQDKRFRVVELSRNFGKEAALTAGMDASRGDAVIPIDADLQDPPSVIPQMIEAWEGGAEVVLARRVDRSADGFLKRKTAELFYSVHNRLSPVKIPSNVGDFRLMDRKVVDAIRQLPERQRFMKGLLAWVGYQTRTLDYTRAPRVAGRTKFSGWKLWNFALEGITSFSIAPLKLWTYIGLVGAALTLIYSSLIVLKTLVFGVDVPGYASLLVAILFFGSVQLIGIGMMGEYIGRIYMETKGRPIYIVRKTHDDATAQTSEE